MSDHPAPDPVKLLGHLEEWERGDIMPGMAMSNLKKGGLAELLDGLRLDAEVVDLWARWEKGAASPADVLSALRDGGLRESLAAG